MRVLIRLTLGLIWWSIAFAGLYALHGIGCGAGWHHVTLAGISLHRLALGGAWLGTILVAAGVAWALRPREQAPLARAAAVLGLAGLGATIATGLPILIVPDCL